MKNKGSKSLLIVIILIFIISIISLTINIISIFFNSNKEDSKENQINYIDEWIQEDDNWFAKLTFKDNENVTLEVYSKISSENDVTYQGKYLNENNVLVTYGDEIGVYVFFKKDENTICSYQKECNDNNRFVRNTTNKKFEREDKIDERISDNTDLKELKKNAKNMNLEQTLNEESIQKVFNNYKENEEQITVYLFRGKGCGFCRSFLTFLNNITQEYGKYFKLESYEVWSNENNSLLMNEVANRLNTKADGVPFIVIGDKVFSGYVSSYDDDIKTTITNLYKTPKENRYDIFK